MTYYDRFQLIAYHMPTDQLLDPGGACNIATDLGNQAEEVAKLSADAQCRLKRLIAVAEKAVASPNAEARINTLKIFMAPEFYLRPKEAGVASRSYTEDEKKIVEAVLKQVFSQETFANWLFILGTIVWHQKASVLLNEVNDLEAHADLDAAKASYVVWNTALIVKGNSGNDTLTTFDKMNYAYLDGIANDQQPINLGENKATVFHGLGDANKARLVNYFTARRQGNWKKCFISVGDNPLLFGVEVCMDHSYGILKKAYPQYKQQFQQPPALDCQLLTACGMRVVPAFLQITPDKFILRMDGVSWIPDSWHPEFHSSEIQKVVRKPQRGPLVMSAPYRDHKDDENTKASWDPLNEPKDTLALADALKITPGDELIGKYPEFEQADALKFKAMKEKPLDEAYPQKLVFFKEQKFSHVDPVQAPQ